MKKWIAMVLVLALCLSLCACSAEQAKNERAESMQETQEPIQITQAEEETEETEGVPVQTEAETEPTVESTAGRPLIFEALDLPAMAGNVAQVSTSMYHIAVLRTDGTVTAVGDNDMGQCNVYHWHGIEKIYTTNYGTIGLKEDGTAVSTWFDCTEWTDIEQVYTSQTGAVGLRYDGTVVLPNGNGDREIGTWTDIKAIVIGDTGGIAGLKKDGTLVFDGFYHDDYNENCTHCTLQEWSGIDSIFYGGTDVIVANKTNGTVVASRPDMLDVSGWAKVKEMANVYGISIGISTDGRLLTDGMNNLWTDISFLVNENYIMREKEMWPEIVEQYEEVDLSQFKNLQSAVIWNPGGLLFGLKNDGSLVKIDNAEMDLSQWTELKEIVSLSPPNALAGVRKDGTAVSWSYAEGYPDISSWQNIIHIYGVYAGSNIAWIGLQEDGTFIGTDGVADWDLSQLTN